MVYALNESDETLDNDNRSEFEKMVFHYVLLSFMILRLLALFYFIKVTLSYVRSGRRSQEKLSRE